MLAKSRFTEIVGGNIRKYRQKAGLSQDELASKCGFYRTYINLVETAKRTPSSYTLYKLAKGLSIDIENLYPTTV